MNRLLGAMGFVCVALGTAHAQGESVTLRWRFPEGETVGYQFDQERAFEIRRPGAEAAKQRRSRKTSFTLTGQPAETSGENRLEVRLLRLRERKVEGKRDETLDTGTLEQPGNWEQARTLLQPIQLRLSACGEPTEVLRFGERGLGEMPAAERAHYASVLGDGIVRSLVFSLLGSFPERPLRVGSAWTSTTQLELPGHAPVTVELTNTVERFLGEGDDLVAVIRQVGASNPDLLDAGVDLWQQEGEIHFHVLQGQILTTQFVSRLVSSSDEQLVEVDTAHRLVRDGETPPGEAQLRGPDAPPAGGEGR